MEMGAMPETRVTLTRLSTSEAGTHGVLSVDGRAMLVTLEPPKAIVPPGQYKLRLRWSPRFKRKLFEVADVPGHTDVLIHPGNTIKDTKGCILVGTTREGEAVLQSRKALRELHRLLGDSSAILEVRNAWP